jgi:hypothetical protein
LAYDGGEARGDDEDPLREFDDDGELYDNGDVNGVVADEVGGLPLCFCSYNQHN